MSVQYITCLKKQKKPKTFYSEKLTDQTKLKTLAAALTNTVILIKACCLTQSLYDMDTGLG